MCPKPIEKPRVSPGSVTFLWLLVAAAIVALIAIIASMALLSWSHHLSEVRRGQDDLARQMAKLTSGQTNALVLYDTRNTDDLLLQIEGSVEVEELVIELTDVSESGMASVATLPRLRKLVLYGGRGITDRGLAKLKGITSLDELELINTQITNKGLRALRDLPNLRSLKIFCEPRLGTLDDAGLAHLEDLQKLETLSIAGGWASPEAVANVGERMPKCKVARD
jgi:hypothetical protein